MDNIDKKILQILQENGRITNQDLADEVDLSTSPCLRRVKSLEDAQIINKYVALLDEKVLNLSLTVILSIGLDNHAPPVLAEFAHAVKNIPEVMQCYLVAGQSADYLLKIVYKLI